MDGGLAHFELLGEFGAGMQTARAQSLKSARQPIGGPHQRNLPGGKCLLLPVCISKFIESRGDLLVGTQQRERGVRFMKELLGELFDALCVGRAIAEEGCRALVFDGELVVNIEVQEQESRVLFTGQLAPFPEHLSTEQTRQLMALNLALARYHRMSIGLETHSGQLVLCHDVGVSQASLPTLEAALAQLLRQVELCRKMLQQPDVSGRFSTLNGESFATDGRA
ncbi:type III secretion system chaperone [Burkholderia ubonensis]|uniref:type III secretion system chaperone n=1 Tax=Burkholderia ubonensis TaxID=101571 RepID=UPI00075E858F|nr:type III secretion system chaperone [Burkholderia ubonensis]KVP30571.1 hypothetical protein WJ88_12180 [Burkholderia ubonensis]